MGGCALAFDRAHDAEQLLVQPDLDQRPTVAAAHAH